MPFSTNAPFNETGNSQVLRDIEYLYLKLQELNNYLGTPTGDLQPGGGTATTQQNPTDAWGKTNAAQVAPPPPQSVLAHRLIFNPPSANSSGTMGGYTTMDNSFGSAWDPVGGNLILPYTGIYQIMGTVVVAFGAAVGGTFFLTPVPGSGLVYAPTGRVNYTGVGSQVSQTMASFSYFGTKGQTANLQWAIDDLGFSGSTNLSNIFLSIAYLGT